MNLGDVLSVVRETRAGDLLARGAFEAAARTGIYRWRFRPYSDTTDEPAEIYLQLKPAFIPRLDLSRLRCFYTEHPDLRDARVAAADKVAAGRIDTYNRRLDLSAATFSTDIVTGKEWPRAPHGASYPFRQGSMGDVKYTWEANNFHFAPVLAQAAVLTSRRAYYDAFKWLVGKWIEENPRQSTVNWCSNLEIGIRLFFWLQTWELFRHAPGFADWSAGDFEEGGFFIRFSRSIHAQLRFMLTHLLFTKMCVKVDHILGDLLTMIYVLNCYPLLPEAGRLPGLCAHLEREFRSQFYADGAYEMGSLNYQRYATEFLLAYLSIRQDLPEDRRETLTEMARKSVGLLAAFSDEQGESLRFGENDSAHILRLAEASCNDFGPLFLWAQSLTGEAVSKKCRAQAEEAAAWMNLTVTPRSGKTAIGMADFPLGGYWCWRDNRVSLWVRTGRRPPHSQGQADLLSFALALDGNIVVVQPGSGLYNGGAEIRAFFRGALSHSCLMLDKQEPMTPWGRFRWIHPAKGWGRVAASGDGWIVFAARHDGFERLGAAYRRVFLVLRGRGVAVIDCVSGRGRHRIERGLHCPAPPTGFTCAGVEEFALCRENAGVSPTYGEVVPSHLLVESADRELPWVAGYYIGLPEPPARVTNEGERTLLEIDGRQFSFWIRGDHVVLETAPEGEIDIGEGRY